MILKVVGKHENFPAELQHDIVQQGAVVECMNNFKEIFLLFIYLQQKIFKKCDRHDNFVVVKSCLRDYKPLCSVLVSPGSY